MSETAKTERWFYAGRRVTTKGKQYDAWYDGEQIKLYPKTPGVIGAGYDVEVSRDGDGTTMHGKPKYVASAAADTTGDLVRGWKVEDADARHEIETKREEKRAAEDDEVQDALDVLRRHFHSSRSYSAKWGFAQWVAAEVARPPRDKR